MVGSQPSGRNATPITHETAVYAHAVNSRAKFAAAVADAAVNMLEADIILAKGPESPSGFSGAIAVMGHTPGDPWDLTVQDWLRAAARERRLGIKLDIKQAGAVPLVLSALTEVEREEAASGSPWPLFRSQRPGNAPQEVPAVIINADILRGPWSLVAKGCRFNRLGEVLPRQEQLVAAREFVKEVTAAFPLAILSPGWSTAGEWRAYTEPMVDDMLQVVGAAAAGGAAVTFPVRGTYVRASWPQLRRLLAPPFSSTSLTVWSNVPLPHDEEAWLRSNLDPERTMYDLVPRDRPSSLQTRLYRVAEDAVIFALSPEGLEWATRGGVAVALVIAAASAYRRWSGRVCWQRS